MSLHHRLFLLRPRLSASPAVARGRLPRVAVAVVRVTCRFGGLDAMVPQTLSSLPSMGPVDAPALGGLTRLPGVALLRLAAVNGLQSCGPALGIDSMQSAGACVAACGGGWEKGSLTPVYCSEPSAASMRPRRWPHCIVYGLHVGWPRYCSHASQPCYCSPASVEIVSVIV